MLNGFEEQPKGLPRTAKEVSGDEVRDNGIISYGVS